MALIEIRPEARILMRALAGDPADHYFSQILAPAMGRVSTVSVRSMEDAEALLLDPIGCLQVIFGHYAFLRRGKDRAELSEMSLEALDRACDEESPDAVIAGSSGHSVWTHFETVCAERKRKPMAELNLGVIAGLVELTQEIHRSENGGSIAQWLADAIVRTGRIEPEFMRIVDVRGVGPKFASVFFRDVVHVLDLEQRVENLDQLYLQPIDKWIRLVGEFVLESEDGDRPADWILAGKLSKYARQSGVSGIRVNMGATYKGAREARSPEEFEGILRRLAKPTESGSTPTADRRA